MRSLEVAVGLRINYQTRLRELVDYVGIGALPGVLRERLHECEITELITAYCEGATAAFLTTAHGVSLRSVKRLLHTAGIRRISPTRRAMETTPAAAYP